MDMSWKTYLVGEYQSDPLHRFNQYNMYDNCMQ